MKDDRTGAQERDNYFEPKATSHSLSRLPVEFNFNSYERNGSLSTTMKIDIEIQLSCEKWKLHFF